MPSIWSETVEQHRHDVREAILDQAAALVREHGLYAVTMSRIAKETGIGRATLYKYFHKVEEIIVAWHHRQVTDHLERLTRAVADETSPFERLTAVIRSHAEALHQHHDAAVTLIDPYLPGTSNDAVRSAHDRLLHLLTTVLNDAAAAGQVRTDSSPGELASFVLHSLGAASTLSSPAAVDRLVNVVLSGLVPSGD